jgi:hypothetical protein
VYIKLAHCHHPIFEYMYYDAALPDMRRDLRLLLDSLPIDSLPVTKCP